MVDDFDVMELDDLAADAAARTIADRDDDQWAGDDTRWTPDHGTIRSRRRPVGEA